MAYINELHRRVFKMLAGWCLWKVLCVDLGLMVNGILITSSGCYFK